jgi:hypothetical protein
MSARTLDHLIAQARAVRVEDEIARRGIQLRGLGVDRCGPCPRCGGSDRFSINLRKQVFNCRGFGGGDVIAMVQHFDAVAFAEAVATLTGERLPAPAASTPRRISDDDDPTQRSRDALRIWNEARPIGGTLAETYLTATRCVDISALPDIDDVLRFHLRCVFGQGERLPCLLALMRDIKTDEPTGIIRVALSSCGEKLDRKMLGRKAGAAVKLWPDAAVTHGLVVGEGLETVACAATRVLYMGTMLQPAWALCDATNLASFPPLPEVEHLTILVDHDTSRTGENAAEACMRRWTTAGRSVELLKPRKVDTDFADLVRQKKVLPS